MDPEYADRLTEFDGFSHIGVLAHLYKVDDCTLRCDSPFAASIRPSIFVTGGPNLLGFAIVRLREVNGHELCISVPDLVDCTPVLNVKLFEPNPDK